MPKTRWQNWLDLITPRSGRVRCEDGEWVNTGSIEQFRHRNNLISQTLQNGATEIGKRCEVPSEQSTAGHYYALQIPEGKRLYIWQRDLKLTQGRYKVDLVNFPDGYTGGAPAFKAPLDQGRTPVESNVLCGVTPIGDGTVVMELPLVDTGTTIGQARASGAAAVDGALKRYTGGNVLIRVQRTEAAAYTSSILMIVWEDDAE